MFHTLAERLHTDEKQFRTILESTLLQYGMLLGVLLLLVVLGRGMMYFWP